MSLKNLSVHEKNVQKLISSTYRFYDEIKLPYSTAPVDKLPDYSEASLLSTSFYSQGHKSFLRQE